MPIKKVAGTGLKILAVCLLFTVCMAVGVSLSGLDRAAQQGRPAQTSSQTAPQPAQVSPPTPPATDPVPGKIFLPLLAFSLGVGTVESYLILRSSWHGWTLAGAIFVGTYGISTVVNQIESMFFLSNKFPPGLIRAIFLQGAIATALFAPLAVLVLGKWRVPVPAPPPAPARMRAASAARRVSLLVVAFVFLYMFFGYYVAWQNPELRTYYTRPRMAHFLRIFEGELANQPLDISAGNVSRPALYRVHVPADPHAPRGAVGGCDGHCFVLGRLDHRASVAQLADASQRGPHPFLGDPGAQPGLRPSSGLALEHFAIGDHQEYRRRGLTLPCDPLQFTEHTSGEPIPHRDLCRQEAKGRLLTGISTALRSRLGSVAVRDRAYPLFVVLQVVFEEWAPWGLKTHLLRVLRRLRSRFSYDW